MLLEDTHVNCIRCGADVTIAENVSMYPIEVMETIEEENQRKKASGKIVAMIIGLIIALVGLVLLFLYGLRGAHINMGALGANKEADTAQTTAATEPLPEETAEAQPADEAEPTPAPAKSDRKVKDDKGVYYDYVEEKDDAGNVVFTAIVPEDLTVREFYKNYEVADDRYPFEMNFTASTDDNAVRFTYLSPRRLWYKVNDNGRGRSDEQDLSHYMTYFKYENDRSYLEPLLTRSYPGAKLEIKNEYDVSEKTASAIADFAKEKNKELFGDIGDYAHMGKNTTYANMDYVSSAKVYEYEITLTDKNVLFAKYYIPSMAHNLSYANSDTNDRGTITEWYNFAIVCLEAGNEDDYDDYKDAFDMFIDNALPTDLFMFINESYSKDIDKAVESFGEVQEAQRNAAGSDEEEDADIPELKTADPLDETLLKKYGSEYKPSTTLDDFDAKVMSILRSAGPAAFKGESMSVYAPAGNKVAFFDKAKNKVFLSGEEDEYPGDSFEELKSDAQASDEAAPSEDSDKDKDKEPAKDEADKPKPKGGVE